MLTIHSVRVAVRGGVVNSEAIAGCGSRSIRRRQRSNGPAASCIEKPGGS